MFRELTAHLNRVIHSGGSGIRWQRLSRAETWKLVDCSMKWSKHGTILGIKISTSKNLEMGLKFSFQEDTKQTEC